MPDITGLTSIQQEALRSLPKVQMTRLGSPPRTIDGWSSTIPKLGTSNYLSSRKSASAERAVALVVLASQVWMAGGSVVAMESPVTCYFTSEERKNL